MSNKSPPAGPQPTPAPRALSRLPPGIWALGFVSMFMDISSELVHSLLPIFLTTVLGAGMLTIGLMEGVAEALAQITKVFSGAISDYLRQRKLLAVLGYGLSAITKPVFPLATSIAWVFAARLIDRVGKGIRGAPRDALVADIIPPAARGAAYGLRQALDSVGAALGPLLALAGMFWLANNIKAVLWVAVAPAFIAVAVLMLAVREPAQPQAGSNNKISFTLALVRQFGRRYWLVVLVGAVFTLARFSEAFLVLRALNIGLAIGFVPMVMVVMNVIYALAAWPAGIAADRVSRKGLLLIGLLLLILADLVLALAAGPWLIFAGVALWGLHMGCTQGLLSKLVADSISAELRGTAFGVFNMVTGVALLCASVLAGALWKIIGPAATFLAGAVFAAAAASGILIYRAKPLKLYPTHNRQ